MGVMIQCETCKVWQHCPCVGLGDGLVTPDKYYCDSCRPENHPYHVVDGVLMTNAENTSSAVAALKVKSPKTKSSARESKMSTDRDNVPDAASSEHNFQTNITRASKRRKKTDSTLDDLDQTPTANNSNSSNNHSDDESETTPAPTTTKNGKKAVASADKDKSTHNTSKNSSSNAKRRKGLSTAHDSATAASSIITTTMTSNHADGDESSPNPDHDSESASASVTPSTRRNARTANTKKNSRAAPADDVSETAIAPASKRRRTADSTSRSKEEAAVETEEEDKTSDKDSSINEVTVEAPATRSRKGHGTRANKKASTMDEEHTDSNTPPEGTPSASEDTSKADSAPSHPETSKRSGALRKAHGHHGHHSRHGSPSGTPQPTQIVIQPTKIKYPSAKMTIPDMNKRVRQLLEYMGHAQAEMTELKKNRDTAAAAAAAKERDNNVAQGSAACGNVTMAMIESATASTSPSNSTSSDPQPAWLSTPPRSDHEPSRSESLDPMTQSGTSTVLSSDQNQDGPAISSSQGVEVRPPMTPPSQNESGSCGSHSSLINDVDDAGSKKPKGKSVAAELLSTRMSCLEQIDKLTRDLLCFQQKFGHKADA
ncbi:hypothetical protein FBU30_006741 [Linnemannia zychae]|nr:hypothetical protein FBU30_006741 [Linnemannia zychae]